MSRVAIVTTGAHGIGAAVAVRLAGCGMDVALLCPPDSPGREAAGRIAAAGGRCEVIETRVDHEESVRSAVARVTDTLGGPDVLVNTVGQPVPYPAPAVPGTGWYDAAAAGLRSAFLTSRAVLDAMAMGGWGRIINVTGQDGSHAQATLRSGLEGFTRTVAEELRPLEITVNLVVPASAPPAMVPSAGDADPDGRYPDLAAEAVRFLAGDAASWVSGQVIRTG